MHRSRNPSCPLNIRFRAARRENQSARSTSGNSCILPDFGGHSIENVLLRISRGEQSPWKAQAVTNFPLGCLISSSAVKSPLGTIPVSSSNSRLAASSGSSSSPFSPFGIHQTPTYFCLQIGLLG